MKSRGILSTIVLGAILTLAASPAGATTRCDLYFHVEGWSAFYKTAWGGGRVTCDNGQVRHVAIRMKGGGLTVGRSEIHGHGDFSPVADIRNVFGSYANAEAHAGIVRSAAAQVVTKGTVSLAFAGKGEGVDLGIAFGKLTIAPAAGRPRGRQRS
jgi:hypothetical protein